MLHIPGEERGIFGHGSTHELNLSSFVFALDGLQISFGVRGGVAYVPSIGKNDSNVVCFCEWNQREEHLFITHKIMVKMDLEMEPRNLLTVIEISPVQNEQGCIRR